jgi:hypothetical protein
MWERWFHTPRLCEWAVLTAWNRTLDTRGRFAAVMTADGLFTVELAASSE